jgi:hypothetical protein
MGHGSTWAGHPRVMFVVRLRSSFGVLRLICQKAAKTFFAKSPCDKFAQKIKKGRGSRCLSHRRIHAPRVGGGLGWVLTEKKDPRVYCLREVCGGA